MYYHAQCSERVKSQTLSDHDMIELLFYLVRGDAGRAAMHLSRGSRQPRTFDPDWDKQSLRRLDKAHTMKNQPTGKQTGEIDERMYSWAVK